MAVSVAITKDPHNSNSVPRTETHANLDTAVEHAKAYGWTATITGAFVAGRWVVPPPAGAMVKALDGTMIPALHPDYKRRVVRVAAGVATED